MDKPDKYIQLSLFPTEELQNQGTNTKSFTDSFNSRSSKSPKKVIRPKEVSQTSSYPPMPITSQTPDLKILFQKLAQSPFRSRFHLSAKEKAYVHAKSIETIRQHATDLVAKRLAPANLPNDGKQTPMRGHPVFIAQHATGCCCRGCFCKWHHIPTNRAMTLYEQQYAVKVLMTWILREMEK